jgi:hypothetical protein
MTGYAYSVPATLFFFHLPTSFMLLAGIAFRAACIPETHRQRSIKADQPNRRAQ